VTICARLSIGAWMIWMLVILSSMMTIRLCGIILFV
jgi:hypothetical protein